jgi:hypothetical protein
LRVEVHTQRVEEGLHDKVQERALDKVIRGGGNVGFLVGGDEHVAHGKPEQGDGHGRGQEQRHGVAEHGGEDGGATDAERLAAHGSIPVARPMSKGATNEG